MRGILRRCAALALCVLLLSGCARLPGQRYEDSYFDVFDTFTTFSGYATSKREFQKYSGIVHGEMLRLHRLFDIYHSYEGINNLKTINDNAGIAPVKVDADLIMLLTQAKDAYDYTDGTVNVALGAVLGVWHRYREEGLNHPEAARLPPEDQLAEAARHTSIDDMIIDVEASTVFLRDPRLSLDVGAIAKGYATQSAVKLIKDAGLTSGVLNAGGNVCVIGSPGDGRLNWSVGVQAPDLSPDGGVENYDTIFIRDCAVVSSGDYQRFYTVNGVAYHHIIDPATLKPAARCREVSIIHPDATMADILSTASFILPRQKAMALVEEKGGQGIWILKDGSSISTAGYAAISESGGAVQG